MSMLLIQGYVDEQITQRQQIESASMVDMICNILNFLDASPMTLFEGPPYDLNERDRFYQENLEALISCVVAPDESVRRLGTKVAKRLYANDVVLQSLRTSKRLEQPAFKLGFWRLTYVPSRILELLCTVIEFVTDINSTLQIPHPDVNMRQSWHARHCSWP